jgi:hypothetical protein
MGATRAGEAGTLLYTARQTVVVPNITDGDHADVAMAANANFAGNDGSGIVAAFAGAPLANLCLVGAWISNETTGVVTLRFAALSGNVATGDQEIRISEQS